MRSNVYPKYRQPSTIRRKREGMPGKTARRLEIRTRRALRASLYDEWCKKYGTSLSYDQWHHPEQRRRIELGRGL
jgi:hypothetical protein